MATRALVLLSDHAAARRLLHHVRTQASRIAEPGVLTEKMSEAQDLVDSRLRCYPSARPANSRRAAGASLFADLHDPRGDKPGPQRVADYCQDASDCGLPQAGRQVAGRGSEEGAPTRPALCVAGAVQ